MNKTYSLELDDFDLDQLLDGLESRAEAWERTADYHRTGESPVDFVVEECNNADEADAIANHYRSILTKIRDQRDKQP